MDLDPTQKNLPSISPNSGNRGNIINRRLSFKPQPTSESASPKINPTSRAPTFFNTAFDLAKEHPVKAFFLILGCALILAGIIIITLGLALPVLHGIKEAFVHHKRADVLGAQSAKSTLKTKKEAERVGEKPTEDLVAGLPFAKKR
jgi:uncharacterized membrane protein